jgi:ribosome-binding factor A
MKAQNSAERAKRLESRIQKIVASEVEFNMTDPHFKLVTITSIKLTGDLQHATIYWTSLGNEAQVAATQVALQRAKGRVRTALAQNLTNRLAPTVEFKHDVLREQVDSIEDLLAQAKAADSQVARQREGRQYAGDADPYKVTAPDVADDEGVFETTS